MTISDRIFERLKQLGLTQKEFSEKTGILQSTISEWKKKGTNPSSDKILIICRVLDISPEWLLSGVDPAASRGRNQKYYVVDVNTDTGELVAGFNRLEKAQRDRILGYLAAFGEMGETTTVRSGKSIMTTRKSIDKDTPLSSEQLEMLEKAETLPIVYDEDSPELFDGELAEFKRIADSKRSGE
ncbi:MAG: helix-turn-helix domain-containing protein [Lachnospiraceae bacterium]|nr:helix-turn-helix domain-containing protein [Lachnospiraceae bacterium]